MPSEVTVTGLTRLRCCVLVALSVSACGSAAQNSTASSTRTAAPTPRPSPTATPVPALPAPAIVQVENSPAGRPQSGLAAANLVYEYVAEGGVGRFSLFFYGAPPASQLVGPVRSARTATVGLATIYQAFVAYSGASTYIHSLLSSAPFPSYDEDSAGGNLFRISSRAVPHNLYTDGQHLAALATTAAQPATSYQLWQRTAAGPSSVPGSGPAANPVSAFTVPVSDTEQPVFTWQPGLGGFTRTEDTGVVVDPASHAPLLLPTVIVQQVAVTTDPRVIDVIGHLGVDHQLTGSGPAQVFTGGRVYAATWVQPAHGPPQFTLANGSPAPIAPGEVWISLVATGQPALVR